MGGWLAHGEPTKVDYRRATVRRTLKLSEQAAAGALTRAAAGKTLAAATGDRVCNYLQVGERGHVVEDAVGKLRDFIAVQGPEGGGGGDKNKQVLVFG